MLLDNYYHEYNSLQMGNMPLESTDPRFQLMYMTDGSGTKNRQVRVGVPIESFRLFNVYNRIIEYYRTGGYMYNSHDVLILGSGSDPVSKTDNTMSNKLLNTDGTDATIALVSTDFQYQTPIYDESDKSFTSISTLVFRNTSADKTIKLREWGIARSCDEYPSVSYGYYLNLIVREVLDQDILIGPEESVKMTLTTKFYLPEEGV